jgi:hypothetical protein
LDPFKQNSLYPDPQHGFFCCVTAYTGAIFAAKVARTGIILEKFCLQNSIVAEPHHLYAAPAPEKIF